MNQPDRKAAFSAFSAADAAVKGMQQEAAWAVERAQAEAAQGGPEPGPSAGFPAVLIAFFSGEAEPEAEIG